MRHLLALTLAALLASPALAHDYRVGALKIDHPWSRAMPPASTSAGAFLAIANTGQQPDRLLSASSPHAGKVELHSHVHDNGVMRMREVEGGIALPAGGSVRLAPGGLHVMLFDIKTQAKAGDSFPLTLQFDKAGSVTVTVKVEAGMPAEHH